MNHTTQDIPPPAATEHPTEPVTVAAGQRCFQRLDTTAAFPYSLHEYARRFAWELVQKTIFRYSFRKAARWRCFLLRRFGAKLGRNVNIKSTTVVRHPWLLSVGDHSCLAEGVNIYNLGPVTIGEHTVLSQDVYVCAGTHDYTKPDLPLQRPPITVGNGVWVCAGAFLGPGVVIGDNCVIGARAVVSRDVPPGKVAAGNPAVVVKDRRMGDARG